MAGQIVQPPAANDVRPGGLLAAATTPTDQLTRNVPVKYVGVPCGGGWKTYAVDCDASTAAQDHGYGDGTDEVTGHPFLIQVERSCSTFGWQVEDYETRVRAHLTQIESAAVAREFWTGELTKVAGWSDQVYLTDTANADDITPAGGAVSVNAGYARIQQALGEMLSGEPGAIHVSRRLLGYTNPAGMRREGNNILDLFDNRIVADSGYPDSGDATGVIYGTARPVVRRSAVEVTPGTLAEAVDRAHNTITYSANRLATVTAGCGVVAVRVTLS